MEEEIKIEEELLEEEINLEEENTEEEIRIEQEEPEQDIEIEEETSVINNDKNYLHIQNTVSNVWVINHNLNKFPSVTVIDSAGNEVVGDIEYIDVNNLTITFRGAFKGKATLN